MEEELNAPKSGGNCDGSTKDTVIGVDGLIIRNSDDNWITEYSLFIGKGHILKAELWSIQFGLQSAKDNNITNLIIKTNSNNDVDLLNNANISSISSLLFYSHSNLQIADRLLG